MKSIIQFLVLIVTLISVSTSYARCTRTYTSMNTADSYATPLEFGKINLTSAYLQPVGSIVGHLVVPPNHRGAPLSTVLWTCDESDLPNIYFLVATNGDEPFGGHVETGALDGLSGVYATWWRYIGLKQTMAGVTISRYWQKVNIENYALVNGKVQIRLMDIPPLEATLYRISNLPSYSRGSFCNSNMIVSGSYKSGKLPNGLTVACNQPSAYIQLSGDNNVTIVPGHDKIGADSNTSFNFWGAYNGFAYGLNTASSTTLSQAQTCVARNATPNVNFQAIPAIQLKNNDKVEANFNVEVECNESAKSGVASDQTAIGFQPSNAAYLNAQKLNLINTNGSVQYLVSDDYNSPLSAKGVGIQLENATTQTEMHFLNQYAISGGGQAAGWYPVLEGNPKSIGSKQPGYQSYLQEYKAILSKLPNENPQPGKVKATATVVVKIQ